MLENTKSVAEVHAFAKALAAENRFDEAAREWSRFLDNADLESIDNRTLWVVSRAFRTAGQAERAEPLIKRALDRAPDDPRMIAEGAEVATALNRNDEAIASWHALVNRGELGASAHVALVKLLNRTSKPHDASIALSSALALFPDNPALLVLQATELRRSGRWNEALARLTDARAAGVRLGTGGTAMLTMLQVRSGEPGPEPLAAEEDLEALKRTLSVIEGQDCIVFGSAPDPTLLHPLGNSRPILSCNASSRTLQDSFGTSPSVSFINRRVLERDEPLDCEAREALAGVADLGAVIFLGPLKAAKLTLLEDRSSSITHFTWENRFLLQRRVLDLPSGILDISTGGFAVLAACFAGACSVELAGMSLMAKGHSYNPEGRSRNHISSDAALLTLLSLRRFVLRSSDPVIGSICRKIMD